MSHLMYDYYTVFWEITILYHIKCIFEKVGAIIVIFWVIVFQFIMASEEHKPLRLLYSCPGSSNIEKCEAFWKIQSTSVCPVACYQWCFWKFKVVIFGDINLAEKVSSNSFSKCWYYWNSYFKQSVLLLFLANLNEVAESSS